jgi:DNA-binding NtrC family response regulator
MNDFSQKTVLIVDDEKLLREYFAEEFRELGAETISAGNAQEALRVIDQHNVDVVLTDVRMPDGDGVELLKKLTTRKKQPLLFFITGYADIDLEEALSMGALGIFNKPCDFLTIASEISTHFTL